MMLYHFKFDKTLSAKLGNYTRNFKNKANDILTSAKSPLPKTSLPKSPLSKSPRTTRAFSVLPFSPWSDSSDSRPKNCYIGHSVSERVDDVVKDRKVKTTRLKRNGPKTESSPLTKEGHIHSLENRKKYSNEKLARVEIHGLKNSFGPEYERIKCRVQLGVMGDVKCTGEVLNNREICDSFTGPFFMRYFGDDSLSVEIIDMNGSNVIAEAILPIQFISSENWVGKIKLLKVSAILDITLLVTDCKPSDVEAKDNPPQPSYIEKSRTGRTTMRPRRSTSDINFMKSTDNRKEELREIMRIETSSETSKVQSMETSFTDSLELDVMSYYSDDDTDDGHSVPSPIIDYSTRLNASASSSNLSKSNATNVQDIPPCTTEDFMTGCESCEPEFGVMCDEDFEKNLVFAQRAKLTDMNKFNASNCLSNSTFLNDCFSPLNLTF